MLSQVLAVMICWIALCPAKAQMAPPYGYPGPGMASGQMPDMGAFNPSMPFTDFGAMIQQNVISGIVAEQMARETYNRMIEAERQRQAAGLPPSPPISMEGVRRAIAGYQQAFGAYNQSITQGQNRSGAAVETGSQWGTLGQSTYTNPLSGQPYSIPNTCAYAWVDNFGQTHCTETYQPPTYSGNYTPLTPPPPIYGGYSNGYGGGYGYGR